MKKILKNTAIIFALSVTFIACGKKEETKQETETTTEVTQEQNVGMPNPFVEVSNLDEATKLAGFTLSVPETYGDYKKQIIQVLESDNKMIEVIYFDENENEGLRIRKAVGTEDISGDYNEYPNTETLKIGDYEVVEKSENGNIFVTIWNDGTYSYSISADKAELNAEVVADLVQNIK